MTAQAQKPIAFNFENHPVRTTTINDELWFVAQDVMDSLEYAKSSNPARVIAHLPEEWKGVNPIHTNVGKRKALFLSEQGLYFFLGRSDKPKALPFQKWLAGEVLPSIRKTGSYSIKPDAVTPDLLSSVADIKQARLLVSFFRGERTVSLISDDACCAPVAQWPAFIRDHSGFSRETLIEIIAACACKLSRSSLPSS